MTTEQMDDEDLAERAEDLAELADALARGEPVPAHLDPLWRRVRDHPEALARLEAHERWWRLLGEAAARRRDAPVAHLVLAVRRDRRPVLEVLSAEGWGAAAPGSDPGSPGAQLTWLTADHRVRCGDLTVSIDPDEASGGRIVLRLRGPEPRTVGVRAEAFDPDGGTLATGSTDEQGVAAFSVGAAPDVSLLLQWPA